nr:helix-turn-helix domain-containing protein [Paenibacillus sp. tmac-D7]
MSKINEYCGKEKLAILKELETGQGSLSGIAYKYSINVSTLKEWRRRYEVYGAEGLEFRSGNKSYTAETKLQAVQDYLSGKYSQNEIIRTYRIASRTQLRSWIKKYNSHSGLRPYKNGGVAAMTKGRTTTWEERIDIVLYCLSQNRDYPKAAEELSEVERQRLALKKLEAENEWLRAENALLKKLEELERRRY